MAVLEQEPGSRQHLEVHTDPKGERFAVVSPEELDRLHAILRNPPAPTPELVTALRRHGKKKRSPG